MFSKSNEVKTLADIETIAINVEYREYEEKQYYKSLMESKEELQQKLNIELANVESLKKSVEKNQNRLKMINDNSNSIIKAKKNCDKTLSQLKHELYLKEKMVKLSILEQQRKIQQHKKMLSEHENIYNEFPMAIQKRKRSIELTKIKIENAVIQQELEDFKVQTKQLNEISNKIRNVKIVKFVQSSLDLKNKITKYRNAINLKNKLNEEISYLKTEAEKKNKISVCLRNNVTEDTDELSMINNKCENIDIYEEFQNIISKNLSALKEKRKLNQITDDNYPPSKMFISDLTDVKTNKQTIETHKIPSKMETNNEINVKILSIDIIKPQNKNENIREMKQTVTNQNQLDLFENESQTVNSSVRMDNTLTQLSKNNLQTTQKMVLQENIITPNDLRSRNNSNTFTNTNIHQQHSNINQRILSQNSIDSTEENLPEILVKGHQYNDIISQNRYSENHNSQNQISSNSGIQNSHSSQKWNNTNQHSYNVNLNNNASSQTNIKYNKNNLSHTIVSGSQSNDINIQNGFSENHLQNKINVSNHLNSKQNYHNSQKSNNLSQSSNGVMQYQNYNKNNVSQIEINESNFNNDSNTEEEISENHLSQSENIEINNTISNQNGDKTIYKNINQLTSSQKSRASNHLSQNNLSQNNKVLSQTAEIKSNSQNFSLQNNENVDINLKQKVNGDLQIVNTSQVGTERSPFFMRENTPAVEEQNVDNFKMPYTSQNTDVLNMPIQPEIDKNYMDSMLMNQYPNTDYYTNYLDQNQTDELNINSFVLSPDDFKSQQPDVEMAEDKEKTDPSNNPDESFFKINNSANTKNDSMFSFGSSSKTNPSKLFFNLF